MLGYRLVKSSTYTLKNTPGLGSTTNAPIYFLPLVIGSEYLLVSLSDISSFKGMR